MDTSCALERLEPRALLAAVAWDGGGGDGDWANPLNWNRGGVDAVPVDGDDVTINVAGAPTVTFTASAGTLTLNSLTSNEALVVAGGSLAVTGNFALSAAAFTYTGGTLAGTPVLSGGTLNLTPTGASPVTFVAQGAVAITGDINVGQTVWVLGSSAAGTATLTSAAGFTNNGIIRLESTNGRRSDLTISAGILANAGSINVSSGGSRWIRGSITNQGTLTVSADARLDVVIAGSTFRQESGLLALAGLMHIEGATFIIEGGAIEGTPVIQNARLQAGPNAMGSMTAQGTTTLLSNIPAGLTVRVLGVVTLAATLTSATGFVNAGTIRLESISTFGAGSNITVTTGVLVNQGTIVVNAGTGGSREVHGNFTNEGIVTVAADAVLTFQPFNRTVTHQAGTLIVGGGLIVESGGTFHYAGGNMVGIPVVRSSRVRVTATDNGIFSVVGNSTLEGDISAGPTVWVRGGEFGGMAELTSTTGFTNAGTILLESAISSIHSSSLRITAGTLINTGSIVANRGTGGDRTIIGAVLNQGLIEVNTALIVGPSGSTLSNAAGGVIRLTSRTNTPSSLSTLFGLGTIANADGGMIEVLPGAGGTRTITAVAISNAGTIRVAPAVVLQVTGSLTQQATGDLNFDVDQPGVTGRINVSGTAILGGSLTMNFINQFVPTCSQSFTFVTATTQVGTFAAVNTPAPPAGLQFVTLYTGNQTRVVASSIADVNRDGFLNSQDFFDFLTDFIGLDPAGDFNGDGTIDTQDFFSYLTAFFNGCG